MGRLSLLLHCLLCSPALAHASPSPCDGEDEEERIQIQADGFLRWCEGPDGPTTPKLAYDRAGDLMRPKPKPLPPAPHLERLAMTQSSRTFASVEARARPFVFSNWGPGRGAVSTAIGLRFFPTLTEAPVPAFDFTTAYAPIDALKLELRVTLGGLVNAVDLGIHPRLNGGADVALAPRIGLSLLTSFNDDWNVGFGPRTGLGLSFGSDDFQLTFAAEIIAYLVGAGRSSPDKPRNEAAFRAQIVGEFDLSPTQRHLDPFGPASASTGRASLFIELALERPLAHPPSFAMPLVFSSSLGVVF